MTNKFNIGEVVMITEGEEKDNIAVIDKITYRSPVRGKIRYMVCTLQQPNGFMINEAKLDLLLDSQIPLLESAAEKNHIFSDFAMVKGGFNSIKLGVYSSEGKIPHFHFYKGVSSNYGIPRSARTIGGCICFNEPKYFIHGSHTDTMDKKEIKGLIEFLNKQNNTLPDVTIWRYMILLWNDNNPYQTQIPISTKIPEYTYNMKSI